MTFKSPSVYRGKKTYPLLLFYVQSFRRQPCIAFLYGTLNTSPSWHVLSAAPQNRSTSVQLVLWNKGREKSHSEIVLKGLREDYGNFKWNLNNSETVCRPLFIMGKMLVQHFFPNFDRSSRYRVCMRNICHFSSIKETSAIKCSLLDNLKFSTWFS